MQKENIGKSNSARLLVSSATPYSAVLIYMVYNGNRKNCINFINKFPKAKIAVSDTNVLYLSFTLIFP
ncbi:hypothetical protein CE91St52_00680 [Phascolarctobacterium faecium]|nr:hypothetical protein CE91St52_00680 [Phascolarctobacterium faecium]BDE92416.1 hypothetical protein CE91St53_00680 [Phascolarctobacterium faecium]